MKEEAKTADQANNDAIAAKSKAVTAEANALSDYNTKKATATTANSAASTPLAGLVTKRDAAATAWTNLDAANTALAAKKVEVANKKLALTAAVAL